MTADATEPGGRIGRGGLAAQGFLLAASIFSMSSAHGQPADLRQHYSTDGATLEFDVPYARVEQTVLALDLFLPRAGEAPCPVIVFIHGGAWMTGQRFDIPREIIALTSHGYAVATVDYRLSRYDRFPANVHDVKASVRFLRGNARKYGLDPDRIALVGLAAGGHLAILAGNACGDLEGTIGDHTDVSSVPQAIVSFHGPTNLRTILLQRTPTGMGKHRPPVEQMLGGPPEKRPDWARLASPVEHINANAPPILLVHGDADDQVPVDQAYEMQAAYRKTGSTVEMLITEGANHRSLKRMDQRRIAAMEKFLGQHMPGREPPRP